MEKFSRLKLKISKTEDIFDDIYQSDVVLGCETQALVIALMMKRPLVISTTLGSKMFTTTQWDYPSREIGLRVFRSDH